LNGEKMGYPSWRHHKDQPEGKIIYSESEEAEGWEDPAIFFAAKDEPKKDEPSDESPAAEDKVEKVEEKPKKKGKK
jgi:hypothetical protein